MKYQRYVRAILFSAALLVFLATTGVTQAQEATVEIAKKGTITSGGSSARVTLKVSCPAGMQVLEAFVYIVQDESQSQFGGFGPTCDGTVHTVVANVNASPDTLFHKGKANASAFMLVLDPVTQNTLSAQDSQAVKLKVQR